MKIQKTRKKAAPPRLHWRVYPSHEVLCHLERLAAAHRRLGGRASRATLERSLAHAAVSLVAGRGAVDCLAFLWRDRRYALSARFRAADLRWIVEIGLAERPLPLLVPPQPRGAQKAAKGRRSI